jgi:hypothetical protein
MAKTFFERIKGFIMGPGKAFEAEKKTSLKEALIYGLKGMFIFAIPYSIIFGFSIFLSGSTISLLVIPLILIGLPLLGVAGGVLGALWYHLWAYIFGAKQGWVNTTKALFYANTPIYILGWIPIVNLVISIWSLILFGMGLKRLQKLSTGRAAAAILIAVLIPVLLIIGFLIWMVLTFGPAILAANKTTSASLLPY